MRFDLDDTIAAIATPPGGALRGIVRLSGPGAIQCAARRFSPRASSLKIDEIRAPRRIEGIVDVAPHDQRPRLTAPAALLVWPGTKSFTRQPSAEVHTFGAQPLLAAILDQMVRDGARLAEPGEFTLRAFLSGRIDLTQAEAVLGVVDAQAAVQLDAALAQLAGGLSGPLHVLRDEVLNLLAELEAGLDFADEDIELISRETLRMGVASATDVVASALMQLQLREDDSALPQVVLYGKSNIGKSTLFNALVDRFGSISTGAARPALTSSQPGTTRDYVTARITLERIDCELIDTAGELPAADAEIDRRAQRQADQVKRPAQALLHCVDAQTAGDEWDHSAPHLSYDVDRRLVVLTRADLAANIEEVATRIGAPANVHACSSASGAGIETLGRRIGAILGGPETDSIGQSGPLATAVRCAGVLREAASALQRAEGLIRHHGGEELIAAELRLVLDCLGEVVGAVYADDVLDRIFSQFCIGK